MNPHDTAQKLTDLSERSGRQRRRFFARRPKKLSDVLAQLVTKKGYGATETDEQLRETWNTAAGAALARFSQATRVNRGRLEVTVANSMMMQELSFEKTRILAAVRAALPEARIEDLKLRVGKID